MKLMVMVVIRRRMPAMTIPRMTRNTMRMTMRKMTTLRKTMMMLLMMTMTVMLTAMNDDDYEVKEDIMMRGMTVKMSIVVLNK